MFIKEILIFFVEEIKIDNKNKINMPAKYRTRKKRRGHE